MSRIRSIEGRVQVTQAKSKWDPPVYVRHMERGDSFGEAALQSCVSDLFLFPSSFTRTDPSHILAKKLDHSM